MTEILDLLRGVDPFTQLGGDELSALAGRAEAVDLPPAASFSPTASPATGPT